MTNQEAFDIMVNHLRTMPGRSVNARKTVCQYRNSNGNKCAVGVLIPDNEYDSDWDINTIGIDMIYSKIPSLQGLNINLLQKMQDAHDNPNNWKEDQFTSEQLLACIAYEFHLEYTPSE